MDDDIKGIDGSLGPGYNLLAGYFYYGGPDSLFLFSVLRGPFISKTPKAFLVFRSPNSGEKKGPKSGTHGTGNCGLKKAWAFMVLQNPPVRQAPRKC
jgi:hypothetical protein